MSFARIRSFALTLGSLAALAACSSGPKVQEFPDTANANEEVRRLATDLQVAKDRQTDVLSPAAFHDADHELKAALRAQEKKEDRKDILHSVARGRAYLDRADHFAGISRQNMEEVVAARQAAIKAGAPNLFADDFQKADDHLRKVTAKVEDDDTSDIAKNRSDLQKEYLDIELKSIQEANLGAAKTAIAEAKKAGAKDYASQSLAIAEKLVTDTEAFIVANRHDDNAIKARAEETLKAANHLRKITQVAKETKKMSPEETALQIEGAKTQAEAEKQKTQAEKAKTQALTAQSGVLKSEQAFNRTFETARSQFNPDEAEVYRKGNQLVIRLRALEFPRNESVLRSDNFPLLSKVAGVIKEFDNPKVVVEGHTDSDGGKALNKKLSTERSEAVSSYLVSTGAISSERIENVGYGFERPLASNKTAKGKAQNRRVDIVITPEGGESTTDESAKE